MSCRSLAVSRSQTRANYHPPTTPAEGSPLSSYHPPTTPAEGSPVSIILLPPQLKACSIRTLCYELAMIQQNKNRQHGTHNIHNDILYSNLASKASHPPPHCNTVLFPDTFCFSICALMTVWNVLCHVIMLLFQLFSY